MTLAETAKKLDVSFYQYVFDRVSGRNELPALADILRNCVIRSMSINDSG
jgi:hypothetical protein